MLDIGAGIQWLQDELKGEYFVGWITHIYTLNFLSLPSICS